jgi:hypothetical protein
MRNKALRTAEDTDLSPPVNLCNRLLHNWFLNTLIFILERFLPRE